MKEFPINDLLTTTDIDTTRIALQNILAVLKKVRHTKYPTKRAVALLSTISSDLSTQMIQA
jgi:hypothetical protein